MATLLGSLYSGFRLAFSRLAFCTFACLLLLLACLFAFACLVCLFACLPLHLCLPVPYLFASVFFACLNLAVLLALCLFCLACSSLSFFFASFSISESSLLPRFTTDCDPPLSLMTRSHHKLWQRAKPVVIGRRKRSQASRNPAGET